MKERKNLTIHSEILSKAKELMERMHYSDLSSLIEQLIREEYERRSGPISLKDPEPLFSKPKKHGIK